MEKKSIVGKIDIIILFIFAISLLTFIFTPFTGDLKVLLAGSNQAEFLKGNWLERSFRNWDLKGELYRLFLFCLYKIVVPITGFSSYAYEVGTNFTFALFTVILTILGCILAIGRQDKAKILKWVAFIDISIFASLGMSHLQAEMVCVEKLLLCIALYMNYKRSSKENSLKLFIIGIIVGTLLFYKSVLILMSVAFVAAIWLFSKREGYKFSVKEFLTIVLGAVISLLFWVTIIYFVNPSEFQNMLDASVYQNTLFSSEVGVKSVVYNFSGHFIYSCIVYPVVLLGVIAGIVNLKENCRERRHFSVFLQFILWGMPAMIIVLANCYFDYHFFLFAFSALTEIFCCRDCQEFLNGVKSKRVILFLIITILWGTLILICAKIFTFGYSLKMWIGIFALVLILEAVYIILVTKRNDYIFIGVPVALSLGIYISYMSIISDNFVANIKCDIESYDNESILKQIDSGEICMYLDDGTGAYVLGLKSYLDEYYPLPIQRIYEGSEYENRECHIRVLEKALGYDGKYISVNANWIFSDNKNIKLQQLIAEKYHMVGEVKQWSMNKDIFEEPVENPHCLKIYEKN